MNRLAALVAMVVCLGAVGCDDRDCPEDEQFVVEESGTCSASPQRFTLRVYSCRVSLIDGDQSGLPLTGSMDASGAPLRQGGFILYGKKGEVFQLCRARRAEFRLELSCVDGSGDPICDATLTEPPP